MTKRAFNFSSARKLIKRFKRESSFINTVKQYPSSVVPLINDSISNYKNVSAVQKLAVMRVEQLEKVGASKIASLRGAGYKHVSQLLRVSPYQLINIYGIGKKTAEKIMYAVRLAYQKAYQSTNIKLEYDHQTETATKVVSALFKYFSSEQLVEQAEDINRTYGGQIIWNISKLKRCKNIILWLFSKASSKESANSSFSALTELSNDSDYVQKITSLRESFRVIKKHTSIEAWNDFKNNPIKYFNYLDRGTVLDSATLANIKQSDYLPAPLLNDIENQELDLEGLKCHLRKYQIWGVKYIAHQQNVLLGDEMGLGKTVEAIASLVHFRNKGETHFLVIRPAGVLINWFREIQKHSDLKATMIHDSRAKELRTWINYGGVAVTTYGMLKNIKLPYSFKIGSVVIDEAHYIKHLDSQRSIFSRHILTYASNSLLMTGTALENNVGEMVNLISLVNNNVASKIHKLSSLGRVVEYRKEIASVYCRRKREEVLEELPQLIEENDWCRLGEEEKKIYNVSILSRNFSQARRLSWNVEDLSLSSKAKRLKEIIQEAKDDDRKVLIFSFFLKTLESIQSFLSEEKCFGIIRGSVSAKERQYMIDEFEAAEAGSVLISQIEAGGMGLNIQAASIVILCEPQFKPSTENQAISRSYRMGQARNVIVHRLLCEDTIDERLTSILEKKQIIFDNYADKSVASQYLATLDAEIGDAFKEEFKKIASNSDAADYLPKPDYSYYSHLLYLSYSQIVSLLLDKYGPVEGDYFINENCQSKNSAISRANEGLECHHIDEYTAINLSNISSAKLYPFEYQRANRLVYCNYLEHLLLHIKIAEEQQINNESSDSKKGIGGAVEFIVRNLNDFYNDRVYEMEYMNIASRVVSADYDAYILYLRYLWNLIKSSPDYSAMYTRHHLVCGFDGAVNTRVLSDLNK